MITKEQISPFTFRDYVKRGVTRISDQTLQPGDQVLTLEGKWTCAEPSRLALDIDGNVYPIAESVFEKVYEPV